MMPETAQSENLPQRVTTAGGPIHYATSNDGFDGARAASRARFTSREPLTALASHRSELPLDSLGITAPLLHHRLRHAIGSDVVVATSEPIEQAFSHVGRTRLRHPVHVLDHVGVDRPGCLKRILPGWSSPAIGATAIHRAELRDTPRVRAFLEAITPTKGQPPGQKQV